MQRSTMRQSHGWLGAVTLLLSLVIGTWAWTAGFGGPYHFDDHVTPLNDPASESLAAWRQYLPVTLRPVTKLSYALEAGAGAAAHPAPRRAVSLLLHALSAGLLLLLIARLAPGSAPLGAAFLAAIWFIHPVHADSVLLISGRTAVLSGLFLLASLLALERGRRWVAALLFVLACLSRETALAGLLPLVVLSAGRPRASLRSAAHALTPVMLGAALVALWIFTTPRYLHLAEYSFLGRPFWYSFASQVGAVPVGIGVLFNPAALSVDYGIPLPSRAFEPLFLAGALLYIAAATTMIVLLRRSRAVAVGLALWLAALLPTQSVIPKLDALSNRPLSLALAGLLLATAPVLAGTLRRPRGLLQRRAGSGTVAASSGRSQLAGGFCMLALFSLLLALAMERAALFRSELSLWQDAAAKSRRNTRPHLQYAALLKREGRDREAFEAAQAARAIDPFNSRVAAFVASYRFEEVIP